MEWKSTEWSRRWLWNGCLLAIQQVCAKVGTLRWKTTICLLPRSGGNYSGTEWASLWLIPWFFFKFFITVFDCSCTLYRATFSTQFVYQEVMYPSNPEGPQVIVSYMNMGYDIYPTLAGIELTTYSCSHAAFYFTSPNNFELVPETLNILIKEVGQVKKGLPTSGE